MQILKAMLHQELLEHFYHCLKTKNAEGMISFYHDDIEFTDPAFGTLKGIEAKSMWHMLISKGKNLEIDYSNISADAEKGKGHWTATYTFSKTNRNVINKIMSSFEFKDEKIIRHTDTFDLQIWAKQALGFKSNILYSLGILQSSIQRKSKEALHLYIEQNK
jgi:limonene-1,2-epoxide hydrolase